MKYTNNKRIKMNIKRHTKIHISLYIKKKKIYLGPNYSV